MVDSSRVQLSTPQDLRQVLVTGCLETCTSRGSQAGMRGRVSARWLRARVSLVLIDLSLALRSRPSTTPHHHVHRRPLCQSVTCNVAAPDTNPVPTGEQSWGALLKKCAVPPPFPHAVPQVISRKPLVHFQVGAQHGASPCHFYVSRAPGAAPMACCKSGWCVRVGHRIGAVQACRLLLSRVALLLKLDARSGQTSLGTAALKSA